MPQSATPVLLAEHLGKQYGNVPAVVDLSFTVNAGEIVGLLGPNGAGKTTTINMLLGVLAADSGRITIAGHDLARQRTQALLRSNFAAIYAPLPGNLSVEQNLRLFAMLYNVPRLQQRIDELIEQFHLQALRAHKCGVLSSGEQTRVSLAKALLNRPQLLLLDEPTASLDPATARQIRAQIRAVVERERTAVLWTSHNMLEVEEVCDRVLFLSRGRLLLQGKPRELPAQYGQHSLEELFIHVASEPLAPAHS